MVTYSKGFREKQEFFRIKRRDVEDVVDHPDEHAHISADGASVSLYYKADDRQGVEWLVVATAKGADESVTQAFRLPKSLVPNFDGPVDLLRKLCDKYGLLIRIAGREGRIFIHEVISHAASTGEVFTLLEKPTGKEVFLEQLFRIRYSGVVDVALAFAIDAHALRRAMWDASVA